MQDIPIELRLVVDQLKSATEVKASVRTLLAWFGNYRRSWRVVQRIREALAEVKLITVPDFTEEYIDGEVAFQNAPAALRTETCTVPVRTGTGEVPTRGTETVEQPSPTGTTEVAKRDFSPPEDPSLPGTPSPNDPTQRLKRLRSANQKPIWVHPDQSVIEAVTLMIRHDYSQLPVMTNDRTVRGMISWRSIGGLLCLKKRAITVRDCIEVCAELQATASLFDAIPAIIRHGCVLVRDATNLVCGIVTPSDISELYEQLAGPFLYLSEIENAVRHLIASKLDRADLQVAKDPEDTDRIIETVADLTFGEYVRLLQREPIWQKVGLGIDRKLFTEGLDAVRIIRNDVMHFDPDGIDTEQVRTLQEFTSFLRRLRILASAPAVTESK